MDWRSRGDGRAVKMGPARRRDRRARPHRPGRGPAILGRSCRDEVGDDTTTIAKQLTLEIYHMLRGETVATATGFGRALNCSASGICYGGCVIFAHRHSPPRRRTAAA